MKPKSLLSEKDYDSLLDEMRNHPSPSDFLRACEADFLPINRDFYKLLVKAVERAKPQGQLNAFLIVNPGYLFQEAKRTFYGNLIELEELIMNRAFAQMPGLEKAVKEFGKEVSEISKRIKATMSEAMEFHALHKEHIAELAEVWENAKRGNKRGYHSKMAAMDGWFKSKFEVIPESYQEFRNWFFFEKKGMDGPVTPGTLKSLANVETADFWEFAEAKKAKEWVSVESRKKQLQSNTPVPQPTEAGKMGIEQADPETASFKSNKAMEHLRILSGRNVHGRQIMSNSDFLRLQSYVEFLFEQGQLPEKVEPISQVDFPNGHIRYLFWCIHAERYTRRKIQDHVIDFLHAVFPKFTGKKETTKHKFGEQPTTWERDLEKMKGG